MMFAHLKLAGFTVPVYEATFYSGNRFAISVPIDTLSRAYDKAVKKRIQAWEEGA
jgi:hypothetical protein